MHNYSIRKYSFSKSVNATVYKDSQFLTTLPSYFIGIFLFTAISPSGANYKISYNSIVTPSQGYNISDTCLICSQNISVGTQSDYLYTQSHISNIYYCIYNAYPDSKDITFSINGIYVA